VYCVAYYQAQQLRPVAQLLNVEAVTQRTSCVCVALSQQHVTAVLAMTYGFFGADVFCDL